MRRPVASLLVVVAALACAGCRTAGEPVVAEWDLLALVRADPAPPTGRRVRTEREYDEVRHVIEARVPDRIAYALVVPPGAVLDFGFAVQAPRRSVPEPARPQPVRVRAVLDGERGREVLFEQRVNVREEPADRRWFDARIPLDAYAGESVSLALELAPDGRGGGDGPTVFLSAPRVLETARADRPSVLFITIDCLRADHLGAWGYPRPTSPRLDALAAGGVRFAHAFTGAPMTMPSMPQFFTGRVFPTEGDETLIGPIARAGIPSAAIVNNPWLFLWLTVLRGGPAYDYFDLVVHAPELTARHITDRAIAWIDRHPRERFALALHYLDVHSPYGLVPPAADVFGDPAYAGPVGRLFNDPDGARAGRYDAADRARVVSLYDAAIAFVDGEVGRLLDHLADTRALDRTIVVVSADHGEELWDRGGFFHGQSLHDELLHVPLIVRLPEGAHAGTVVERQVRSIDVAPSLLGWMGLAALPGQDGNPLAAAMAAPGTPAANLVATATNPENPTRYALRTPVHKLIEDANTGARRLYDLAADPGETRDVLGEEPVAARALGERLEAAREPLRARGWQVRVVGRPAGARFRLVLENAADGGTFATIDRVDAATDLTLDMSTDAKRLVVEGRVADVARGARFDRPSVFAGNDAVGVTLEVDGVQAPASAVQVGARGALPPDGRLEADAPELTVTEAPSCAPPSEGVRACVWRWAPAAGGGQASP